MSPHPYPAYKPSGVEWLGDVPVHWEVRRLGDSVIDCVTGIWGSEPNGIDDLPCVRVADFDRDRLRVRKPIPTMRAIARNERRRRMLRSGDLLLEKSGGGDQQTVGVVILFDHDVAAVCSNFVARMPVHNSFDSSFLAFLHSVLYSIRLNARSIKQTTGIQNLDSAAYLNEAVAFPPLPEQAAIVRYLDHVDGRIRRYVDAKRQLVALLEEERRAVIERAVTRGLDPNVRLKPSGVEWLGDVPEHWEVRRLKQVCSRSGLYGANIAATQYQETGIRFLRITDITDDGQLKECGVFLPEELTCGYVLNDGDILISRSGTIGRSFLYQSKKHGPCSYAGYLVRFVPDFHVLPKYISLFTKTQAFDGFLRVMAISSTIENVNADKYANAHLPLPPLAEQAAIVEYLDRATASIDAAIARARRQIELVEEYRTRLIADVVTGKLDVREAAAHLPEEDGDWGPVGEAQAGVAPSLECP